MNLFEFLCLLASMKEKENSNLFCCSFSQLLIVSLLKPQLQSNSVDEYLHVSLIHQCFQTLVSFPRKSYELVKPYTDTFSHHLCLNLLTLFFLLPSCYLFTQLSLPLRLLFRFCHLVEQSVKISLRMEGSRTVNGEVEKSGWSYQIVFVQKVIHSKLKFLLTGINLT